MVTPLPPRSHRRPRAMATSGVTSTVSSPTGWSRPPAHTISKLHGGPGGGIASAPCLPHFDPT